MLYKDGILLNGAGFSKEETGLTEPSDGRTFSFITATAAGFDGADPELCIGKRLVYGADGEVTAAHVFVELDQGHPTDRFGGIYICSEGL